MADTILIAQRFHGPPNSGNGGYVCGRVASFIDGPAEVSLRAPPPLDTELRVTRNGDSVQVHDGASLIAEGRSARPRITPPAAPSASDAERGAQNYPGHRGHFFPTCFTCGPAHVQGLHIFSGTVREGLVASPWTPAADLADDDDLVAPEFVWAALDCPTYWALPSAGERRAVLGRLTAEIHTRPRAGEPLIIAAWPIESGGRKHRSAAALYNANGAVLAAAEALWIDIKPEQFT